METVWVYVVWLAMFVNNSTEVERSYSISPEFKEQRTCEQQFKAVIDADLQRKVRIIEARSEACVRKVKYNFQ